MEKTGIFEKKIDKSSIIPVYYQLKAIIENEILSGRVNPSERLPSENELAGYFGISRMTVNKALNKIMDKGLILRERGRGSFVRKKEIKAPPTLLVDITEKMRRQGLKIETKVLDLKCFQCKSITIREKLDLTEKDMIIRARRVQIIENEPLIINNAFLPYKYASQLLKEDLSQPLMEVLRTKCGIDLVKSEETIGVFLATHFEAKILGVSKGFPLLIVEGISYDQNNRKIRYSRSYYRGDKFKLDLGTNSLIKT